MKNEEPKKLLPPYVSYKTFLNFLDTFRATQVSRIDRSVMPSLSGAIQSWLIATLKYLKLIEEDGVPTEALKKLAKADDTERKKLLRELWRSTYPFIFDSLDLKSATPRQLEEQFDKTAATGETIKKCIAFFLAAAKNSDLELSPFLQKMRYTKTAKTARRNQITDSNTELETETLPSGSPTWAEILMSKFPTFDPSWPDDVKAKWFDAFKQMMDTMKEREEG